MFSSRPLSFLLYIVVFAASSYCLAKAPKAESTSQRKLCLLLAVLFPSVLSCFRLCGTDLGLNFSIYCKVKEFSWGEIFDAEQRPLYFVLMKISGLLGAYQWFFFFLTLIPCVCACKALYDSREKLDLSLAYTVFLFNCITASWNVSRQFVAVGITCFAVRYVFSRQLLKFLLCVYLAYLFHPSSIVMLAVYPLWTKEQRLPSGWKLFLYYATAIFFVVALGSSIEELPGEIGEEYNEYLNNDIQAGKNRDFLVNLCWTSLFLYYRKKLVRVNPQNAYYLALFGLVCVIGLTGFFSPFIKRMGLYFSVFQPFLMGSLPLALQLREGASLSSGNTEPRLSQPSGRKLKKLPGEFLTPNSLVGQNGFTPVFSLFRRILRLKGTRRVLPKRSGELRPDSNSFLKLSVAPKRSMAFEVFRPVFMELKRQKQGVRQSLQARRSIGSLMLSRRFVNFSNVVSNSRLSPYGLFASMSTVVNRTNLRAVTKRSVSPVPFRPFFDFTLSRRLTTPTVGKKDVLASERNANERKTSDLPLVESSDARSMRMALYWATVGLFFIVAYVLEHAEIIPYRYPFWSYDIHN